MPKLTLRDLFAVVTLAAVLVAWWLVAVAPIWRYNDVIPHGRSAR
jgi:hypothetical protein